MKKKLRELVIKENNKNINFSAIVTAVNIEDDTISVLFSDDKKVINARLKAIKKDEEIILLIPKIGSTVSVIKNENSNQYIVTDVDENSDEYIVTGIDEGSGQYFIITKDEISDAILDLNLC